MRRYLTPREQYAAFLERLTRMQVELDAIRAGASSKSRPRQIIEAVVAIFNALENLDGGDRVIVFDFVQKLLGRGP